MIDGREAKAENEDQGREATLVALTWLRKYCQSLKNGWRSRVLGRTLNGPRNVEFKMPLGSQDGIVKQRVTY